MNTRPHELYKSEYQTWSGMIARCHNPDKPKYKDYGGRGISVCDRWRNSFKDFLSDMGYKPSPELTLERIDNDGNYEPSNCKWATRKEQANNRRLPCDTRYITIGGETKPVQQWAKEAGISAATISTRVDKGYPEHVWLIKGHMPKQYWIPR